MSRKTRLRDAAVRIGGAAGRMDSKAHRTAAIAREELLLLTEQAEDLLQSLKRAGKRVRQSLR